jgi:hypothetical protein
MRTIEQILDIDYVIQLEDENIPMLIKFLQENGFHTDEYDMCAALREKYENQK